MLHAGKLNKQVTIQYPAITRDSYGAETVVWTDLMTVWAQIKELKGKEIYTSQQKRVEIDVEITIRYKPRLNTRMRFKFADRYFDIESILGLDFSKYESILGLDFSKYELVFGCKEVL
jgi:SPP1 family predicted phage head-tail adaptor